MIRIATIGTSAITRRTVAAAGGVPDLQFTTVYSRDAERAAALASDLGLDSSTDDLDALLADQDVDAVYVASPNSVHAGQVRVALEAGKHVLVEKPAVQTVADWAELCDLAVRRERVLLENMRTAYDPVMDRVAELIRTLGPVRRVSFNISQRSSRYDDVLAGRPVNIFNPALGGGALSDMGVYLTHPLARLFGRPTRVQASVIRLETGADGSGSAVLDYAELVAEIGWSKITGGRLGGSIEGEQGTLTLDHMTELHSLQADYLDGRRFVERPEKEPDNITYALRRFAGLIAGGGSAADDHAWSRDSIGIMEAIRQASS